MYNNASELSIFSSHKVSDMVHVITPTKQNGTDTPGNSCGLSHHMLVMYLCFSRPIWPQVPDILYAFIFEIVLHRFDKIWLDVNLPYFDLLLDLGLSHILAKSNDSKTFFCEILHQVAFGSIVAWLAERIGTQCGPQLL